MAGRVKGLRKLQMAMFVVGNPQHKKGGRAVYMMEDVLCITQADISEGPERTLIVYCKKGFSATTTIACFLVDEEYVFAAAADDDEDGRYAAKFDGESFTFFRGDVEVTVDDAAWCADAYLKNVYVMDDFDREKTIPRRTEQLKCRNRVTFGALSDPEHAGTVALVHLMNNLPSAADLRTMLGARLHARLHVAACAIACGCLRNCDMQRVRVSAGKGVRAAKAAKRPHEADGSAAAASEREIGRNEAYAHAYRDLVALSMASHERAGDVK